MGIDLHKKYFVSTIMDKEGKVLKLVFKKHKAYKSSYRSYF